MNDNKMHLFHQIDVLFQSYLDSDFHFHFHVDVDFDENLNGKEVKAKLKKYIANVKKMEKLFEEYEALAEKIEKISGDENDKGVMNEAVVNLREDKEQTEVVVDKATNTVIVKRKKKSNVSQREM